MGRRAEPRETHGAQSVHIDQDIVKSTGCHKRLIAPATQELVLPFQAKLTSPLA